MEKKRLAILIISLVFIIVPFFINVYTIFKLLGVLLGIILLDVFFAMSKKLKIFLLIYLPILLLVFTYSLDYIKTYTLSLSPIYVLENKINDKVSLYNSLLYRVYKCENEYIFDNDYQKSFACDTKLISNVDINNILSDTANFYRKNKNDFIKVTGKISKIVGKSKIEMQEYTVMDNSLNGYVKFNESAKMLININNDELVNYKVYDYITVVGLLDSFDKEKEELTLINTKIEDHDYYKNYSLEVIESNDCSKELENYIDDIYKICISNVYINYDVDKYELSYALKDGKITLEELTNGKEVQGYNDNRVFEFDKFKIVECANKKSVIVNKEENDYTFCDREFN